MCEIFVELLPLMKEKENLTFDALKLFSTVEYIKGIKISKGALLQLLPLLHHKIDGNIVLINLCSLLSYPKILKRIPSKVTLNEQK